MTEVTSPVLPVSLIIVSDYATADGDGELRLALQAYGRDPEGIPAEIVVMLPTGRSFRPDEDPDLAEIAAAAAIIVVTHDSEESSQLKDAGLAHCRHDVVAVVEADCLPRPGWLATLFSSFAMMPEAEAISGRTSYGDDSMMKRVFSLLDRGFLECRDPDGRITHVSNNGALYRRTMLERFPYEPNLGPFISAHLRQHAMVREGIVVELDARALSNHAYEGLPFLWDLRRNKGFQHAQMKLRKAPERGRLGAALSAVMASFNENRRTARAVGRDFCRPGDWPLFWVMMFLVRIPEFAGAIATDDTAGFMASTKYR
ncbi:glycosyltransferase [Mesorhizobium marinum]|uniref:glycosyltransferase n=1 Tax=Mesorhizobium marinum TaxID=3228790 RepID=UPI0034654523